MSTPPVFEIPVDDADTARLAARFADRLEVCRDLEAEGLTPTSEFVAEIVTASRHAGRTPDIAVVFQELPPPPDRRAVTPADFGARPQDLERLEILAPEFAEAGAGSIVLGFVDATGNPDVASVGRAVDIAAASGLRIAFHRAFDLAPDPAEAARMLVDLGVDRTLAAGSMGYDATVASVESRIARLALAAAAVSQDAFSIVPCGGVRSTNFSAFAKVTPHAHASCRHRPSAFELGRFDDVEAAALQSLVHPT